MRRKDIFLLKIHGFGQLQPILPGFAVCEKDEKVKFGCIRHSMG
jgi:hypothetical protein